MRTLEMALKAETKKQRNLRIKLCADVWIQATLFAFALVALSTDHAIEAFCAHFFVLGSYQMMSSYVHSMIADLTKTRKAYDFWLTVHLAALVPCLVFIPLMFVFMVTSTFMALWYCYITVREFNGLN